MNKKTNTKTPPKKPNEKDSTATDSTTFRFKLARHGPKSDRSTESGRSEAGATTSSKKTGDSSNTKSDKSTKSVKISPTVNYSEHSDSQFVGQMSVVGLDPHVGLAYDEDSLDVNHLSKSVHAPWYRRYAHVLREDERVMFQPKREVAHDEPDNAMRHIFGKYYKQELAKELSDDYIKQELQQKAIRHFRRAKAKEAKATASTQVSLLASVPKASATLKAFTLCKQVQRIWQKNMGFARESIGYESNWNLLKTLKARNYIKAEGKKLRKALARKRFKKGISSILHIQRFIKVLMGKHFSMAVKLSELPDFTNAKEKKEEKIKRESLSIAKSIKMFDPDPYVNAHSEDVNLPLDIVMILTKPWFARSVEEIGDVVRCLYRRWYHQKFPIKVQMQMANVAWFTRVKKQRPIVREGNSATRFFIVLTGQVEITELIQDKNYDPEELQKSNFVKYVTKGDKFGDEAMDRVDRVRLYNANSTTTCELLAIDYQDYQESLSLYDTANQLAPPHISFIKTLPLFKSFTRYELIRSGQIQLFYFTNEMIVTSSLENSEFIFIVLTGECHTALKMKSGKSDRKTAQSVRYSRFTGTRSRVSTQYETGLEVEVKCQFLKARDLKTLRDRSDVDCFGFTTSAMTQDFVREIREISETSSNFTKEELVKKIKQIKLLRLMASVYGQSCISHVAEELVGKMRFHEKFIYEYDEEMQHIKLKTLKFQRKLLRLTNEAEGKTRLRDLIERSRYMLDVPHSMHQNDHASASQSTTRMKESFNISTQTPIKSSMNKKNKSIMETQCVPTLQPTKVGETIQEVKSISNDLSSTGGVQFSDTPESHASKPVSSSTLSMNVNYDILSPGAGNSQLSELIVSGSRQEETLSSSQRETLSSLKSLTFEEPSSSDQSASNPPSKHVHYSLPVTLFAKGEIIGNDYINYNDGKYRPPDKDMALISHGAELVMVTKSFLLERLYNHHRRFKKMPPLPTELENEEESH